MCPTGVLEMSEAFQAVAEYVNFQQNTYPLDQIGYTNRLQQLEKDKLRLLCRHWQVAYCEAGIWKQSTTEQAVCIIEDLYQDLLSLAQRAPEGMRPQYLKAALSVSDYTTASKVLNRLAGRSTMIIRLSDLDMKDHLLVVATEPSILRLASSSW